MLELLTNPLSRFLQAETRQPTPPRVSGEIPYAGHVVELGRGPLDLLTRARQQYGDVCALKLFGRELFFLSGPGGNEAVFRATDDQVSFREPYALTVPIFGKGAGGDTGPGVVGEQLDFLMHSLRDERLRTYVAQVADEVDRFLADWGDDGERDLVDTTREISTYTASRSLLGLEVREELTAEFAQLYHDLEGGLIPMAYLNAHLPIPAFWKRDRARRRLVEMVSEIVRRRRQRGIRGEDLLQSCMEASYKSGRTLTDDEITDMLLAAIFAGHHTTSAISAFLTIELLQNPRYLPPIRAELDSVFADGKTVTYEKLRELNKLENAVKETGRLHPPLVMLIRRLATDLEFRGYRLPAGALLVVSPHVSHRIPELFPNPHRFDPDRFGPGREEDKQPYSLITFGGGRHRSLGAAFAHLQIKALWSVVFRRYEIELVHGDSYEPDHTRMVVGPRQPCRIRYRRRVST